MDEKEKELKKIEAAKRFLESHGLRVSRRGSAGRTPKPTKCKKCGTLCASAREAPSGRRLGTDALPSGRLPPRLASCSAATLGDSPGAAVTAQREGKEHMITKSVMQSGSFGILAAGPNAGADKLVNVWFCGAWKVRRTASGRESKTIGQVYTAHTSIKEP